MTNPLETQLSHICLLKTLYSYVLCCYIIWRASLDDSPGPFVVFLDLDHAANKVREPVRSGPEAVAPGSTSDGQVSIVAICV